MLEYDDVNNDLFGSDEIELMEIVKDRFVKHIITSKEDYYILINGVKHGTYIKMYSDGNKHLQLEYKVGKLDGECFLWNKEGILILHSMFKDDIEIIT
jgi:antitoxin component YwqK of YwqJK toxin-antitoxin module